MRQPLTILHAPYGLDHPYQRELTERIPRDPVGGDMVSVDFLTQPGEIAETVRVHWTRNGRPQTPIGARPVMRGTDADRWLVELGVVEDYDEVVYWIEAEGRGQTIASSHYHFAALGWRRLARCVITERRNHTVHLATYGADGRPGPRLTIAPAGPAQTLRIVVDGRVQQPDAASPESPTSGAVLDVHGDGIALTSNPSTARWSLRSDGDREVLPLSLRWLQLSDGTVAAIELLGALQMDEALVGFGERFDALNQHGRTLDTIVYEQYKNQGNRSYLPVPFFLSSAGYGCWIEGTTAVTYDLGRTVVDRWRCVAQLPATAPAGLAFDLFVGTPATMLQSFTALTGRAPVPPPWAFGLWMSSNEWNSQARVLAEVDATHEHAVPATVLVIEAWSDETTFYIWNGAEYTPTDGATPPRVQDFHFPPDGPWPNPKAMIDELHAAGIRLLLWQIPALKAIEAPHPQHTADQTYAVDQGWVLRDSTGQPYRNPAFWFNEAMIPDFTHPEATAWWLSKRAYLLDDLHIDGFKTDGGEHLQGRGITAYDGRHGDELINAFPNLYIGAYHRFTRERRNGDALTFSRAGHTGVGAFPVHWAGDENSTWEAYQRSLVAGLTAAISGIPFWGWDIAGFSEALPTAELYLRATAMAAFCPIMQYHSEYNPAGPSRDRTPWNVARHAGDPQVIALFRFFARLRMNLLPYIISEATHCAQSGEPLLRPLLLDAPDDPQAWQIQDQYGFGRALLVAPVVEEGATTRRLYLPRGTWHDMWSGTAVQGPQWIEVSAPLDHIPAYVRAGAILPLNLGVAGRLGDDVGNAVDRYTALTFWLYPAGHTAYEWVDAAGVRRSIRLEQADAGMVRVTFSSLPVDCRLVVPDGAVHYVAAHALEQQIELSTA